VTLRGNRSILGNNAALLVIDGVQTPISYLGTLNPDDVENVTVLKGASASALYGSAASNGVMIVTTRSGNSRKPQIRLNSSLIVESVAYMPKFQNEFGQFGGETPGNTGNAYQDGFLLQFPGSTPQTGSTAQVYYVPWENQNYGPRYNGQRVPLGLPVNIYNADGSYKGVIQDSINYSPVKNGRKNFFNKGLSTQNGLSYSSGDDKSKFYVSFQDVNSSGIIPNDVSRRDAVHVNGAKESGIFRAEYSVGYTLTHTNTTAAENVPFDFGTATINGQKVLGQYTGGGGSYFQNRPLYWDIINQPGDVNLKNFRNWQTDPFSSIDGYYNAYYGNPWWQIDESRLDETTSDIVGNVNLVLKPTNWLSLQYRAGIVRNDYNNKYTKAGYTFASWALVDSFGTGKIPGQVVAFSPQEGDATSHYQRLSSDFLVTFHKSLSSDITGTLVLGTSVIDNSLRTITDGSTNLVLPNLYNVSNRLGQASIEEEEEEDRSVGIYADASLSYKDYLFLHGSVRNDWTSLLSSSNRSVLYPAVDAAFVFTEGIEGLKNSQSILSYGKIRAAYSQTAQVSIGAYALQNTFGTGLGFPYGTSAGYAQNTVYANPNIKPEVSNNFEFGVDLGFLKNRISLGAAVYSTLTKNQTIPIGVSPATGFTSAYVNSGVMQNQGIELDLKFTPLISTRDGFRWDVGANFSYNKNLVKSLGYDLPSVNIPNYSFVTTDANNGVPFTSTAQIGKAYAQIMTNDWLRDPKGRIIVDPASGEPSLDPQQKLFGTSIAPTKIGLNTTVAYKGFTFRAVADGRFGAHIFNGIGPSLDFTGVSAYSASSGRQPFVIPNSSYSLDGGKTYTANTNLLTKDGNLAFWSGLWNTAGSNYVNSADFWKLREVSLSYTISKKTLGSVSRYINDVTIGITGRNLVTIRSKGNVWSDPEFSNTDGNASGNTDINQLPPTKFYGVNLNVSF
jgi:TonB-linked SusC/RagA family outer membrane protein